MSRGEFGLICKYSNFRHGLYCLVVLAPTCSVLRGGRAVVKTARHVLACTLT